MHISIEKLRAEFGSFVALHGVDLEVRPGQLVTLLGPSGCGKTTLLRSIAGIVHPASGDIRFDGRRMNDVPVEKRNIGMVFQTYALFPHMTIAKNLAFGLEMRRTPREEARRRIAEALSLVELEGYADRYPRQLSGGQQQRVALARAIVVEPDVLLFDEPLSNLDAQLRENLREDLKALQRRTGITSVYVTHDQAEAMAIADHIVVMRKGRIVEQGSPQALYRKPRQRYVAEFLGHTNVVEARRQSDGLLVLPWGALRRPAAPPEAPSGMTALVSIRPEDIHVAAQPTPGEEAGVIEDVTFLGASMQYRIRICGTLIRANVAGERADQFAPGATVGVMASDDLHVLRDDQRDVQP
ncbi:ABC transporter ATP-binding protein [Bosea sp. BK604]|uniref:ABC transporter ATP-binding protein n=1 Tax=Bosea sp. BK604 TaxID=2512180 RepID=UPI00104AAA67|nr:ABC transporter ATP-binding protein [Bosea sp. BK604]TCR64595.1 carbohydrate ABC transporter ATP-binding protein (CUT1 family) [Bosea sp. BK604]